MDRETRKANLKKLQLPSTSGSKQRKPRQTAKTNNLAATNTAITNYFLTPEKPKDKNNEEDLVNKFDSPEHSPKQNVIDKRDEDVKTKSPTKPAPRTRTKRTKLDAFLFKDPNDIPESIANIKKSLNDDDDLVVPEKRVKKAPKPSASQTKPARKPRAKKQSTIKSAFFRNEQLFAEIAAQHCAADQFDGDDVQLALAISRSEAESKGIVVSNDKEEEEEMAVDVLEANKDDTESIREKLKKYGFRTAEKNDYNTFAAAFLPKTNGRRPKCKWANKFTALTLRCPEKQLKKLQENIVKLLNSQFRTKPLTSQESQLPSYKLQSSLLKKSDISENKSLLQTAENVNQANENYFVTELFEVNKLHPGYLLKDWNAIQGRDLTPKAKNKQSIERLRRLQNVYQELEKYFSSKKHLEWSTDNENKAENKNVEQEVEVAEVKSSSSNNEDNQELDKMLELIADLQRNEVENITSNLSLQNGDDVIENIDLKLKSLNTNLCLDQTLKEDLPKKLETIDSIPSSSTSDKEILKILPTTKSLECMQISSCSINTQATINSTQKNRSNSPDLFADDSDVEMEDVEEQETSKTGETVINVGKQQSHNSSMENMEAGVTTYEIFSSDEVKNTSLSKQNDELFAGESSNNSLLVNSDDQIIDLTQDDLEHSKHHQTLQHLNQSKPIVEIDLFADSPTQEDEENHSPDINSNSQLSKYLEKKQESFKLTPTRGSNEKETVILEIDKEETFQVPLSLQTQENEMEKYKNNTEDSLKFTLSPENQEKEDSFKLCVSPEISITYPIENDDLCLSPETSKIYPEGSDRDTNIFELNKEETFEIPFSMQTQNIDNKNTNKNESFKFTLSPEIKEKDETLKFTLSPEIEEKEDSFKLYVSPETLGTEQKSTKHNKKEESFKIPLSLEKSEEFKEKNLKNIAQQDDEEDIILREIAMDQTNTSFLNFQGSKQLETCFHKETATANKKEETLKDYSMGNDTIFRELCNKYLNKTNDKTTSPAITDNLQKTDINRTFSQILPRIKTPQKYDNFTQFTMDFDMTVENNVTLKRKSMSFTAKTPQKQELKDTNALLSKSHSFNMSREENISIDLTQNDDGDEEEDDKEDDELEDECLVLSDDEINYSIWQANKTETNFKTSEKSDDELEEEDVISIADEQEDLELNNENNSITKDLLASKNSCSDFDKLVAKYITPKSNTEEELKFDRSEFGILEEYSEPEPIDYTPNLCTPAKVLNEASFLSSPTEKTAPMKRYSNCHRSSQKFQDLINNLDKKSPTPPPTYINDDDFDEFDRLLYTSPIKSKTPVKKPQGIDKLLTAEISFKDTTSKTPKKKKSTSITSPFKPLTCEKQEIKCNDKTYTVRLVTTPKPDYTKYTEAELLKELYNFGIKPLKRKQAVKMLEYIYNQTHPILMEEQKKVKTVDEGKDEHIDWQELDKPSTSKEALRANKAAKNLSNNLSSKSIELEKNVEKMLDITDKKLNLQDACGWEMLRYSTDLKAELLDENYILQTNVTKKTPQPLLPFHIAWYNLVCSNRKLHETILMYEPIDLQEIYLFLKALGYRYDPKDLKIFFDRRCIIFRYDLTNNAATNTKSKTADNNRHVRKSKKSKVSNKKP